MLNRAETFSVFGDFELKLNFFVRIDLLFEQIARNVAKASAYLYEFVISVANYCMALRRYPMFNLETCSWTERCSCGEARWGNIGKP